MYKVKKISEGSIVIKGIEFIHNKEVEVDITTFNYIKKTFPNDFSFEEEKLKEIKKEIKEKVTKKVTARRGRKKAE